MFYPDPGQAHYDDVTRKQITRVVTSGTASSTVYSYVLYTYDSLNELTAMTTYDGVYGGTESHATLASETFAYDALGNRTNLGFTSNIMNQYVTDANGHALSYNAAGDLTHTYTWDYTFDALNRLTFAAPANHTVSAEGFTYDSMNRLTSKSTYHWDSGTNAWCVQADSTINFVYHGWMLLAKIDAATGHILQSYTWDPTKQAGVGGLLSETVYGNVGGTWQAMVTYIPAYDANANVMSLIDKATGAVVATYTYSAFGALVGHTWNAADTDPNDILFSSHMYDPGTGLIYMNNRWYSPTLGRFMTPDPAQENGGINTKAYCRNDPINHNDPSGLMDPDKAGGTDSISISNFKDGRGDVAQDLYNYERWLKEKPRKPPEVVEFTWRIKEPTVDPTVTSSAQIIEDNGKKYVRVTIRKAAGFAKSGAGTINFGTIMKGTDRGDVDSAQVVAVSKGMDQSGREETLASDNFTKCQSVARPIQNADWNISGSDCVYTDLEILDSARTVNVVLVYTDILTGDNDLPAVIGAWRFHSEDGVNWVVTQPYGTNDFWQPDLKWLGEYRPVHGPFVDTGRAPEILANETYKLYGLQRRKNAIMDSGYDLVKATP